MYTINQLKLVNSKLITTVSDPTILAAQTLLNEFELNGAEGNTSISDGPIGVDIHGNCIDICTTEPLDPAEDYPDGVPADTMFSNARLRLFTYSDDTEIAKYLEKVKSFATSEYEQAYIDHLISLFH